MTAAQLEAKQLAEAVERLCAEAEHPDAVIAGLQLALLYRANAWRMPLDGLVCSFLLTIVTAEQIDLDALLGGVMARLARDGYIDVIDQREA